MPTTTPSNMDVNLQLYEYATLFEDSQYEILEDYARDGKLGEEWLWELATIYIKENNLKGMEKLHEMFGYEWQTPFKYQTLLPIAASYSTDDDTRVFEYMLETGALLYELDYSEDWRQWDFQVKSVIEDGEQWYGVESIELIKWAIEQGDYPKVLYEKMKRYEK